MKRYISTIVLALGLAFTGCMTTNPTTGEKEFDEFKTAMVINSFKQPAAEGVRIAAEGDINTAMGLRIAESVIGNMLDEGVAITRDTIKARMAEIGQVGDLSMEDGARLINSVTDMVLDQWDIVVTYVVRQGLTDSDSTAARVSVLTLTMIREAINRGLANAVVTP